MDLDRFDDIVDQALKGIPEEFLDKLDNISIFVEDFPARHQLERLKMNHGFLLGLYEGTPQTKRGKYGIGGQLPDRITLFRVPILRLAKDIDHLVDIIRGTVMHEIAHHFGMDEQMVRNAEKSRREKRGL